MERKKEETEKSQRMIENINREYDERFRDL